MPKKENVSKLWNKAKYGIRGPVALFKTKCNDDLKAIFNEKGFWLSDEAEKIYKDCTSKPHIYMARLESDDYYYIGKSSQRRGRWQRNSYYHLGALADQLCGEKVKHNYSKWLKSWFKIGRKKYKSENVEHTVKLKDKVIISFMKSSNPKTDEKKLIDHATKILKKKLLNKS